MPDTRIANADYGNMGSVSDFSLDNRITDGPSGIKRFEYQNSEWSFQYGIYMGSPQIKSAIDALALWVIGKGYKADEDTMFRLGTWIGNGMDTTNEILSNAIKTMCIGGDSYNEIVRRPGDNWQINLKPLDPSTIKIIYNEKGYVEEYLQMSKVEKNTAIKKFKPEDIFHLARNRVADESHGIGMIKALQQRILFQAELFKNSQIMMSRWVKPIYIFHLDTDDPAEIATFKALGDKAITNGENMYVPKGAVVPELNAISGNATLNPIPMMKFLNEDFTQISGVPDIIRGGSQAITEASSKILYLAWQQTVEGWQRYFEDQFLLQLGLEIELEFPASLQNELLSDNSKDGPVNIQPNETTAGAGQ